MRYQCNHFATTPPSCRFYALEIDADGNLTGERKKVHVEGPVDFADVSAQFEAVGVTISAESAERALDNIVNHPNHFKRQGAGLYIAPLEGQISKREESFVSKIIQKVPGLGTLVRSSERGYVSYLNKLRADTFDSILRSHPDISDAELKAWADFINKATGRGDLGAFNQAADKLSNVLFSPRFTVSRFQTLPAALKAPGVARKAALGTMAKYAGAISTMVTLAKLNGAEISLDPDSPDYLKIKFGNKRIDVLSGFQQPLRLLSRSLKAGYESVTKGESKTDPLDIVWDFAKYKLAPQITIPKTLVTGKNMIGEERTKGQALLDAVSPISAKEIIEAAGKGNDELAFSLLNLIGFGASSYKEKSGKPQGPSKPTKPRRPS